MRYFTMTEDQLRRAAGLTATAYTSAFSAGFFGSGFFHLTKAIAFHQRIDAWTAALLGVPLLAVLVALVADRRRQEKTEG
jgi:hypothetical protein